MRTLPTLAPRRRSPAAVSQSFLPIRIRVALAAAIAVARSCATPARGAWDVVPATTVPAPIAAWVERERGASEDDDLLGNPSRLVAALETENAEVAAARARIAQLEASVQQSRLRPDPSLDLGVGGINVGESVPADLPAGDSQNYSAGLKETIEIGKREPRIRAAELRLEAERRRFASLLGAKAKEARDAFGREIYLRERIAELEVNLDAARQVLALEEKRLDHGDLSRNDYDRLSLDTTILELDLPRARAEHEAVLGELRAVLGPLGLPSGRGIEALASAAPIPEAPELEAAVEGRADHQALALEMQAAGEDATLARRRAIPDPVLGVEYTHDRLTAAGNQPDTLEVTVGIGLPLFDRGQHDCAGDDADASAGAHGRQPAKEPAETRSPGLDCRLSDRGPQGTDARRRQSERRRRKYLRSRPNDDLPVPGLQMGYVHRPELVHRL